MKNRLINFFRKKKVGSYIAFVVALLTIGLSFVYLGYFMNFENGSYFSVLLFFIILLSGLSYMTLSLFQKDKLGCSIMGILNFSAFIYFVIIIYEYIMPQLMEIDSLFAVPYIWPILIVAAFLLILAIISNVLSYLRLTDDFKSQEGKVLI